MERPLGADANYLSTTVYSSGIESHDGIPTRDGVAPYTPFVMPSPSSPEERADIGTESESSIQDDDDDAASTEGQPGQEGSAATGMPAPPSPTEHKFPAVEPGTVGPGAGVVIDDSSPGSPDPGWLVSTWMDELDKWNLVVMEASLLAIFRLTLGGWGPDLSAPILWALTILSALLATAVLVNVRHLVRQLVLAHGRHVCALPGLLASSVAQTVRRLVLAHGRNLYESAAAAVEDPWLLEGFWGLLVAVALVALYLAIKWLGCPSTSASETSASVSPDEGQRVMHRLCAVSRRSQQRRTPFSSLSQVQARLGAF